MSTANCLAADNLDTWSCSCFWLFCRLLMASSSWCTTGSTTVEESSPRLRDSRDPPRYLRFLLCWRVRPFGVFLLIVHMVSSASLTAQAISNRCVLRLWDCLNHQLFCMISDFCLSSNITGIPPCFIHIIFI